MAPLLFLLMIYINSYFKLNQFVKYFFLHEKFHKFYFLFFTHYFEANSFVKALTILKIYHWEL